MLKHHTPNDVPAVLYKYLKGPHASAMLSKGSVRIGTLREYRNMERYGAARGDQNEGVAGAIDYSPQRSHHQRRTGSLSPPWKMRLLVPGRRADVSFHATRDSFQFFEEWPNCYIYCVSEKLDRDVMRAFDADCAVRINDPVRFFVTLTRHLRRRFHIIEYVFGRCLYQSRIRAMKSKQPIPLFLKDRKYAYQQEARMTWEGRDEDVSPEIIRCDALKKLCSLVEIGESNRK